MHQEGPAVFDDARKGLPLSTEPFAGRHNAAANTVTPSSNPLCCNIAVMCLLCLHHGLQDTIEIVDCRLISDIQDIVNAVR